MCDRVGKVSTTGQKGYCGQTPCIGKVNRGGETPKTRKGQMHPASTEAGDRVPARPSSQHCNYTEFVKTP